MIPPLRRSTRCRVDSERRERGGKKVTRLPFSNKSLNKIKKKCKIAYLFITVNNFFSPKALECVTKSDNEQSLIYKSVKQYGWSYLNKINQSSLFFKAWCHYTADSPHNRRHSSSPHNRRHSSKDARAVSHDRRDPKHQQQHHTDQLYSLSTDNQI